MTVYRQVLWLISKRSGSPFFTPPVKKFSHKPTRIGHLREVNHCDLLDPAYQVNGKLLKIDHFLYHNK